MYQILSKTFIKNEFIMHHCQADYIILTRWLPDTVNTLPAYASTYIGVGGFVVNNNRQILVIKEKNGPITNIWKIPGGAGDPGEDIGETAVREVLEETGIHCEFDNILAFRHLHNARFGKSDIYFICILYALKIYC